MSLIDIHEVAHGWVAEIHSKDTPPDELGEYGPFKKLWDSKCDGDKLPAWRDYELEDLMPWAGWVSVDDLIPGPTYDSRFRLWGTHLTELFGMDLTNKRISDTVGTYITEEELESLSRLNGTHHFRLDYGPMNWQTDSLRTFSNHIGLIELPLADDGVNVDRYINLVVELGRVDN